MRRGLRNFEPLAYCGVSGPNIHVAWDEDWSRVTCSDCLAARREAMRRAKLYRERKLARLSGVRQSRVCKSTGTTVSLVDSHAPESTVERDDGGRWATLCEDHGSIVYHQRLSDAREWASDPSTWCNDSDAGPCCRSIVEGT